MSQRKRRAPAGRTPERFGFLIGPALLAMAAWFLWGPRLEAIPRAQTPAFDRAALSTAPRRQALSSPPRVRINGFERTCMDCHLVIPPREDPPTVLLQHQDVVLDHGINDQCRNCHSVKNRDMLILRGKKEVPFSEDVLLCEQCHGPTYRDWERGMHGRTNGYWDACMGRPRRLRCSNCHDPHDPSTPAMDPIAPLPGPHTLRMGPPVEPVEHHERDPLRRGLEEEEEEQAKEGGEPR